MRDNFTGKAVTMASLRKSVYPSPVWRAHLSNGETLRLSFNCPGGASIDELAARARFQAADFIRWTGAPRPACIGGRIDTPYPRDLRILRLYLEDRRRPGEPWVVAGDDLDPWQDYTSFKRPRTTVKQVKAILADVLKLVNGAGHTSAARATMEQAEQMLAASTQSGAG